MCGRSWVRLQSGTQILSLARDVLNFPSFLRLEFFFLKVHKNDGFDLSHGTLSMSLQNSHAARGSSPVTMAAVYEPHIDVTVIMTVGIILTREAVVSMNLWELICL